MHTQTRWRHFTLLVILFGTLLSACGQDDAPAGEDGVGSSPTVVATTSDASAPTSVAPPTSGGASTSVATRSPGAGESEGELVIYSARKEELMKPLVDAFTEETGVKVVLKSATPGDLALLMTQERGSPRGDVFFTTDAGGAENLRLQGLLEPYVSPNAANVPAEFKSPDGAWTGVIGRSRNIMYNTERVKPDDAPDSITDLTDPRWKGQVAMASIAEGGVRLWLAWLLLEKGEAWTVKYVNDLKANGMKVLPDHTDVANAVGRGEVSLGIVNHYYYVFEKRDGSPVGLIYPDQGEGEMGTLVVPLAVSMIKGAPHPSAAKQFVDFALSADGQQPLTTQESEFPLVEGADLGSAKMQDVRTISEIKRPNVDFTELAKAEKRAVELFTPILGGGE